VKAGLKHLSGTLRERGRALLDRYDADDLHQLRVGLRRMRSFLKSRSGSRAGQLRHELGALADSTNGARDWDTLVERAHRELGPRQVRLFEDNLRRRQAESHRPALNMLQSPQWPAALANWDNYLREHPPQHRGAGRKGKSIARLRARVERAWDRVEQAGQPRNWHKLRIAIKDLRYRLEAKRKDGEIGNRTAMLTQCKRLQAELGDWHDTVVHLQLLRALAQNYDPDTQSRELKILRNWCRTMERQGQSHLDATRSCLESAADTVLSDTAAVAPER